MYIFNLDVRRPRVIHRSTYLCPRWAYLWVQFVYSLVLLYYKSNMNWFFIAILAPFFWSINTHFDKFILSKYSKDRGVGSVFLFSTFFSAIFSIAIFLLKKQEILNHSSLNNFLLFLVPGFLSAFGFYFYLNSLKNEESSVVVALFQLSPVFAYFLGLIFLGEILKTSQIVAALVVLVGAGILSFDIEEIENKLKIKWKMVGFILLAALFFSFNDVLFKKFTIFEGSFVTSLFWQHIGIFIIGLLFFIYKKNFREDLDSLIVNNKARIFILNGVSELFYVLGAMMSNLATLFVPVVLVLVLNTYQTVFTFIIGILLTIFLPQIIVEKISKRHLVQRTLAIAIIILGSYFLYLN